MCRSIYVSFVVMIFIAFVTRGRRYTTFHLLFPQFTYIGLKRHRTKTMCKSHLSLPIYTAWWKRKKIISKERSFEEIIKAFILAALKCWIIKEAQFSKCSGARNHCWSPVISWYHLPSLFLPSSGALGPQGSRNASSDQRWLEVPVLNTEGSARSSWDPLAKGIF